MVNVGHEESSLSLLIVFKSIKDSTACAIVIGSLALYSIGCDLDKDSINGSLDYPETGQNPVSSNISPAALNEDVESLLTLNYTDEDGDSASTCTVSALSQVTESTSCICSTGVCTVGIKGLLDYNGPASFSYTVTTNGQTSNLAAASFSINAVADIPISSDLTPTNFNENVQSSITLSYIDVDGYLATSCSLSSLSRVTESSACNCLSGVCTVGVTGLLNFDGAAGFLYTVTSNSQLSNSASASLNIVGTNHAPIITSSPCSLVGAESLTYGCNPTATDPEFQSLSWSFAPSHTCGLWLAINATSGAITGTPSVTDIGECTLAYMAIDASLASVVQSTNLSICPSNYVAVPNLTGYTTQNFCIMKYEAKAKRNSDNVVHSWGCDDDTISTTGDADCTGATVNWVNVVGQPASPVSVAEGRPWRFIDRFKATSECRDLNSELGAAIDTDDNSDGTYALMTNDEWQSTARNIELVPTNWSSGIVGMGEINHGHSDNIPSEPLVASTNEADVCINTGNAVTPGTDESCIGGWNSEKRTLQLSNGMIIWDFSGNVWEWVIDGNVNDYGASSYLSQTTAITHPNAYSLTGGTTTTARNAKDQFGPAGNYVSLNSGNFGGIGRDFSAAPAGAVIRGGNWANLTSGGLFSVGVGSPPGSYGARNGFRCSFSLP